VALDNIARIVQDNIAAEMVFCTDTKLADALKGPEELLSEEIQEQLGSGWQHVRPPECGAGGRK
jgi:hypothetical protein